MLQMRFNKLNDPELGGYKPATAVDKDTTDAGYMTHSVCGSAE